MEIEKKCFSQPWSRESFEDILGSRAFSTLAARTDEDDLIGYVIFSEVVDELHILNIAVRPEVRRHGIASAMLTHIHFGALKRGRGFAYLEVRESNVSAQTLYTKFGYKPLTKRREYYADNREDAILMVADLKAKGKRN